MHVWTDDVDKVIAADLDGVMAAMVAYGTISEDEFEPEEWGQIGDASTITIHCDASGAPATPGDPGVAPVTRTAAEWVALRGSGFLCTTEY